MNIRQAKKTIRDFERNGIRMARGTGRLDKATAHLRRHGINPYAMRRDYANDK